MNSSSLSLSRLSTGLWINRNGIQTISQCHKMVLGTLVSMGFLHFHEKKWQFPAIWFVAGNIILEQHGNCSLPSVSFHYHCPTPGSGLISEQRNVIRHFFYSYFWLKKCCSITKSAVLRQRMMSIQSRVLCVSSLQLGSHISQVLTCCLRAVRTRISSTLMPVTSFPRSCCCWPFRTVVLAVWDLEDTRLFLLLM